MILHHGLVCITRSGLHHDPPYCLHQPGATKSRCPTLKYDQVQRMLRSPGRATAAGTPTSLSSRRAAPRPSVASSTVMPHSNLQLTSLPLSSRTPDPRSGRQHTRRALPNFKQDPQSAPRPSGTAPSPRARRGLWCAGSRGCVSYLSSPSTTAPGNSYPARRGLNPFQDRSFNGTASITCAATTSRAARKRLRPSTRGARRHYSSLSTTATHAAARLVPRGSSSASALALADYLLARLGVS